MNPIRYDSRSIDRRHGGFSLVEVLLSIGILGVGMAMVAAIFPVAAREAQDSSNTALGSIMCDDAQAIIKSILSGGQRDSGTITVLPTATTWTDTVASPAVLYQVMSVTCSNSYSTDQWVGSFLEIYDGTGKGQSGRIVAMGPPNTPSVQTVYVLGQFAVTPPVGSPYRIIQPRAAADSGWWTHWGGVSQHLYSITDNTKIWSANQWVGWTCFFPTGAGGITFPASPAPATFPISFVTRAGMASTVPKMAHTDEAIRIPIPFTAPGLVTANTKPYQLVLLADENANTGVIHPYTLHYPSGVDFNGTARGCVLFTTKPLVMDTSAVPTNMNSSDSALILTVAYNKSSTADRAAWGAVMVTSIVNANVGTAASPVQAPVVTISSGTLCTGSPLVLMETGGVAKIIQVPAVILGIPTPNTAVLDRLIPLPRNASPAGGLVVQEITPAAAVLPVSPAIAWKISQTGSR